MEIGLQQSGPAVARKNAEAKISARMQARKFASTGKGVSDEELVEGSGIYL